MDKSLGPGFREDEKRASIFHSESLITIKIELREATTNVDLPMVVFEPWPPVGSL